MGGMKSSVSHEFRGKDGGREGGEKERGKVYKCEGKGMEEGWWGGVKRSTVFS